MISLKLPSFTWWGFLRQNSKILLCIFLEGDLGSCLDDYTIVSFVDRSSWVSAFPLFPDCLNLLFERWGGLGDLYPANKTQRTRKAFVPRRAPQGPAKFQWWLGSRLVEGGLREGKRLEETKFEDYN